MRTWGWYHRAIMARLRAETGSNVDVFDHEPSPEEDGLKPQRYLQVLTGGGNRPELMARLSGEVPRDLPIMIMAVGTRPDETLDALQQCDNAMIGWDIDPSDDSARTMIRDDTSPPMISYRSVEGDTRYSISPTYRLTSDR